ncbi:MAG: ABC transporter substrate-binding protein [Burkholderiaceae bacterium]
MKRIPLIVPFAPPGALRRLLWARLAGLSMLLLTASLSSVPARADMAEAPQELIMRATQEVLARIKADPAIQTGDFGRISTLVDDAIMPHVNFSRMTQLAIGLGWRQASSSQRATLTEQFRILLLRTYAGALAQVRDETVRLRRTSPVQEDGSVIVRTEIIGRGEPIELGYRLEKSGDQWRIYDLNILGVWLVATYRNQFRPIFNRSGVDGLIDALRNKNQQAAEHAR